MDARHVAMLLVGPKGKAAGIDSAVQLDDRRVQISLRQARDAVPPVLADPALALADDLASLAGPVRQLNIPPWGGRPFIQLQVARNGDPRDAIDRGVDLAVTRDPSIVEYVSSRPEFVTHPLPWSRTYILLQPAGAKPIAGVSGSDSLRQSLARDAVRAEARLAELPLWSDNLPACVAASAPETRLLPSARVAYLRDDEVARGLAERIVALSGEPDLRVAPLSPPEFSEALGRGGERAFVLSVPRQTMAPCRETAGWPPAARVQPLIDTRARAIVRRGSPPLVVDWDGTVRAEDDRSAGKDLR
jgi:hypothetical protein